ncbi:MAG: AAA family ATPase [Alphaproteobacteria bacterium]|nr:AAA family ATPase [Alphaproteobacteria bacterium]
MSKFMPSPCQAEAIRKISNWFTSRTTEQQVFRLFGYAGTGKTTIVRHVVEELGLETMDKQNFCDGGVLYGAFTGKAALVMTRKGTPALTIHSLIYRVSEATPQEIERVEKELADLVARVGQMGPAERTFALTQIKRLELRLMDIHTPRFVLNEQSLVRDADLLVLDEVSMVGEEMANDLLAFGTPILVLGDPGQLPPIKGEGAFTDTVPDVMLTEIHRQAETSAIIRLATMARQNIDIPFGQHDAFVWKMAQRDVTFDQMLNGGQVLCGLNATRIRLNSGMKRAAGFEETYPTGRGEKIICLKNRHDLGIVNGMFLELSDIRDEDAYRFSAEARTEDGQQLPGRQRFYKGHFDDHVHYDKNRLTRDWREIKNIIESVWGYAITCHKSQGSQWENVIVFDDKFGHRKPEIRARWLYTAITRAEKGLVILD